MNFNFGGTNTPKGAGDAGNTGATSTTPKFGFGQTTQAASPATSSFGFGVASSTGASPAPTFGTGFQATPSAAQPAQGFAGFGTPAKTTAPTLSFGAATGVSQPAAPPTGGFNFLSGSTTPSTTAAPSLSFGLTPASSGQTPPVNTSAAPTTGGLNFGFGAKPTTAAPSGFSFGGTPAKTSAPTLGATPLTFNATSISAPAVSSTLPTFAATPTSTTALSTPSSTAAATTQGFTLGSNLGLSTSLAVTKPVVSATTSGSGFSLAPTSTPGFSLAPTSASGFSLAPSSASTATPSVGFGATPVTTSATTAITTTVMSGSAAPVVSMNFSQLEENINKWTLELEEQEKVFMNQATQVNAWDQLLIENGDKIVMLNEKVERIKQDQFALDHELDFIVSQQIELEDMIAPLERELSQITIRDPEREQSYQLAENLDTQLKQMAEDLKEIIEHLNESNKAQDINDPIVQIGRILNAHMSSLQWVDSSTAQINAKLQQVERMQETLRSSTERAFHRTFE